jgi:hypothetical protein
VLGAELAVRLCIQSSRAQSSLAAVAPLIEADWARFPRCAPAYGVGIRRLAELGERCPDAAVAALIAWLPPLPEEGAEEAAERALAWVTALEGRLGFGAFTQRHVPGLDARSTVAAAQAELLVETAVADVAVELLGRLRTANALPALARVTVARLERRAVGIFRKHPAQPPASASGGGGRVVKSRPFGRVCAHTGR